MGTFGQRRYRGTAPMVAAAAGAALVGALLYAALTFYAGLLGIGGLVAGAGVGLATGALAGPGDRARGAVAAAFTLLACLVGEILSIWWANGIPLAELLSPSGPHLAAVVNTMTTVMKLVVYTLSCTAAWLIAKR